MKTPDGGGLKRPGPAILWVIVYAGLFAAGLVYFRAKSPLFKRSALAPEPARPAAASRALASDHRDTPAVHRPETAPARDEILEGAGLPIVARARYFERLATERCNCGCERSLADCLVNEKSCTRSPVLAREVWRQSRK